METPGGNKLSEVKEEAPKIPTLEEIEKILHKETNDDSGAETDFEAEDVDGITEAYEESLDDE